MYIHTCTHTYVRASAHTQVAFNLHTIHIHTHVQVHKQVHAHAYLVQLCEVDVVRFVLEEGGHALLQCDELAEEGTNVWHSWGGAPGVAMGSM